METDDWMDIAPAPSALDDNVRRADTAHPLDFFRGRNHAGSYIFSLTAESGCRDLPEPPRLHGIEVALERRAAEGARLVLTLQEPEHFDIFRSLCGHLLRATASLARGANARGLHQVLRHLADWHDMLRRRRDDLLGMPERIGLAGELLFLRDAILPNVSPADATASWRGGHRDEQDFAIGHWQFEIKTQLSTADQRLIIASEAQLDTAASKLLLCHQSIAASPPAADTFTLNSLVAFLSDRFEAAGPSAKEVFDAGLEAWGYVRHDEYDHPAWVLTDRRLFEVRDGFPRIVPPLPPGVQKVSYEVLLRDCEPFAVELEQTISKVFA